MGIDLLALQKERPRREKHQHYRSDAVRIVIRQQPGLRLQGVSQLIGRGQRAQELRLIAPVARVSRLVATAIPDAFGASVSNPARLSGITERPSADDKPAFKIWGRDEPEFPGYFANLNFRIGVAACTAPLKYIGHEALATDIANFKAVLNGVHVEEAFLPAVAPGTIELYGSVLLFGEHRASFIAAIGDGQCSKGHRLWRHDENRGHWFEDWRRIFYGCRCGAGADLPLIQGTVTRRHQGGPSHGR
jgi:hypothetical protein